MRQGGTILMQHSHAIIFKQSPLQNQSGQDGLELALTLATFEQKVVLFFKDAGVLQLSQSINGELVGRKTYTAGFKSLDLYDIEEVYVCAESLSQFALTPPELLIDVTLLSSQQWREKLAEHDRALTF